MQDFYPAILKFAIVAALALAFIGVTYLPQQEAQTVMGDNMKKALSSVKEIIDKDELIDAADVIAEVNEKCDGENSITIYVTIGSVTDIFTDSTTSTSGHTIETICTAGEYKRQETGSTIIFTKQ